MQKTIQGLVRVLGFYLKTATEWIVIAAIFLYQCLFSQILNTFFGVSSKCRFTPSCSEYSKTSIRCYGLLRGIYLVVIRLLHCHPFCTGDQNFVPRIFRPQVQKKK